MASFSTSLPLRSHGFLSYSWDLIVWGEEIKNYGAYKEAGRLFHKPPSLPSAHHYLASTVLACIMKFFTQQKSPSGIWYKRVAGVSSASLNVVATEGETLESLIQTSERARAASGRLAAEHGIVLPSQSPSKPAPCPDRAKVSREQPSPPEKQNANHRHPADEGDSTVCSHYDEPPPVYSTWYVPEGVAFRKYRYTSKSGIVRTQLRARPSSSPRTDPTPATRLGTTFSGSRNQLPLPSSQEPPSSSPYPQSRMASSTPDLPRIEPPTQARISPNSVAFPSGSSTSARSHSAIRPTASARPCISRPQALQSRRRLCVSSSSSSSSFSQPIHPTQRSRVQIPHRVPQRGILKSSASETLASPTVSRVTFESPVPESKSGGASSVVKRFLRRDRGG